jgi:hypothetical protein
MNRYPFIENFKKKGTSIQSISLDIKTSFTIKISLYYYFYY